MYRGRACKGSFLREFLEKFLEIYGVRMVLLSGNKGLGFVSIRVRIVSSWYISFFGFRGVFF